MGLVEISNSRHVLSKLSFQNYPSTLIKVFRNKLDSVNKGNKQFLFKFFNETFTKTSVHERNMPFSYNLVVKALFMNLFRNSVGNIGKITQNPKLPTIFFLHILLLRYFFRSLIIF